MSCTMTKYSPKHILISLVFMLFAAVGFTQPAIHVTLNTPGDAGSLSEGCASPYELIIERDPSNTDTVFITLEDLGVALNGVDYNFPAGTFPITMLPSQSSLVIPISVVSDAIEGTESILWELHYKAGPLVKVITINSSVVDDYEVQIISPPNDTIKWCRYQAYTMEATSNGLVQWSPDYVFDPSTGNQVIARPDVSGWYYAMVGTEECGAIDSVYLLLGIADLGADTIYICKDGNGATLPGQLSGLAMGLGFDWIPSDSTLSDTNSLTPIADPDITTTYILRTDLGFCMCSDTVVVRVDSLPQDLHIDVAPPKPYYCEGEIVALFSPAYDSLLYPDLTFNWTPYDNSFNSAQDLLNAALTLLDTTTYIRENINNACSSFDSITLNVVTSGIPLSLTDTTLCPGEMFQVFVLSNQVTEPEWTPETGLSCTECLNPHVTVTGLPGSSLVYNFSGMILECPVGASFSITIPPPATINITASQETVCNGDVVTLTITNPENLAGLEWQITSGSASLSCTTCASPVVTVQGDEAIVIQLDAISTDPNFCGAQGFIQLVHGPPAPVGITASDTIVCPGDLVSLDVINPNDFTGLQWSVVEGDVDFSCTNCINPDVTIHSEDTIKLAVSGQSNIKGLCGAYGLIVLVPGAQEQANQIILEACKDSTVVATTGDPNVIAYHWDVLNGGLSLSCNDCPAPTVTITDPGSLRYFATSNDPDVCKVTGFVNVIFSQDDIVNLISNPDTSTSIGQGAEVSVTLMVSGGTPTNIHWTVNGVSVGGTGTTISFNADAESNVVTVTFTNSSGCPQTATIIIDTDPPTYQIPNAFTPNNDMKNDHFRIVTNGNINISSFRVFNRWGQMVYEGPQNDAEGWDGFFKGKEAVSDTYVYVAELQFPDGRRETAKGDVMLLR